MHESHLHRDTHLFQLHFDNEFLAASCVLEEPFFDTLSCNKSVPLPSSFHLLDIFQTHRAHCHIYQFGERIYSQSCPLWFALHFLCHPGDPRFHIE